MTQNRKFNRDHFALPHPGWIALLVFGVYFFYMMIFYPTSFPGFLGPLATFGRFIGVNYPTACKALFASLFLLHVYEAVGIARPRCISLNLSQDATNKWMLSTLIFGFPSLLKLSAFAKTKRN